VKGNKVAWQGRISGVQSRIRLLRSFDERSHSYLGYVLRIEGTGGEETSEFLTAIGKAAQEKYRFQVGMVVIGASVPVADPKMETAGFYKTSGLEVPGRKGMIGVEEKSAHRGPDD